MSKKISSRSSKIGIVLVFLVVIFVTASISEDRLPYWNASGALAVAIGGMLAAFGTSKSETESQREIIGMGLIAIGGIMIAVATLKPLIMSDLAGLEVALAVIP